MNSHDYANCQDPAACDLCTAHAAGKDSAYKESD